MKYLPLILLLVFGCKKKSTEPIEPSPIVVTPVDTLTRKMSTVVFTYSTHCTGYEMYGNIWTSETQGAPYSYSASVKTKTSGSFTVTTDRRYVIFSFSAWDKPIAGNPVKCMMDLKITINGVLRLQEKNYNFQNEINMYP